MKKRYLVTFLIIALLQLTGCILAHDNGINRLWFFTNYNNLTTGNDSVLTPASFLNLQKDGSYTNDFGVFEYGIWKLKGRQLYLTDSKNKTSILAIEYLSGNEMRISSDHFPAASFESQPGSFKSPERNPFSKENNLWRIHARGKESDLQVKIRLLNHLKFWEVYFTWAMNNELQSVDVRSTPTPITIYGNGFTLKPFSELPREWKSYFYDDEDCQKASNMIRSVFEKKDIAFAHTENKYKFFLSAFQQLERQLR
jgi:hypothetical protein